MPEVIYSPELKTYKERLYAVYSLKEQARLEHNRVGAIARSNWKKYQGKWVQYAKIFASLQLPLLEEQNRLKDAIRKSVYTDEQWLRLTPNQRIDTTVALVGNKEIERAKPTLATWDGLAQLKAIDFEKLEGQVVDPTENATTYTEVDGDNVLTVEASKVTAASQGTPGNNNYVYKDFTANHFDALNTLVEILIGSSSVPGGNVYAGSGFANVVDDATGLGSTDFWMPFRKSSAGNYNIFQLRGYFVAYDSSVNLSADTLYYPKIVRVAGNDTIATYIYSDSGRTILVDTTTVSGYGTTKYRYCYYFESSNYGFPDGGQRWIGYVQNLDLQEGGATYDETGKTQVVLVVGGKSEVTTCTENTGQAIPVAQGHSDIATFLESAEIVVKDVIGISLLATFYESLGITVPVIIQAIASLLYEEQVIQVVLAQGGSSYQITLTELLGQQISGIGGESDLVSFIELDGLTIPVVIGETDIYIPFGTTYDEKGKLQIILVAIAKKENFHLNPISCMALHRIIPDKITVSRLSPGGLYGCDK